ncbi:hypothetical protein ALC57_14418 [Trachymyrmex cornetzi]|uniref:Uncharacterized protein n=1 Tax=Trachymyrmex cornetzi TaxID=471704 RepID=A0A195DKJ9_9HYME|nr:hypothetical protein ALC57_14418 [Trachymyrmex cornetzi]
MYRLGMEAQRQKQPRKRETESRWGEGEYRRIYGKLQVIAGHLFARAYSVLRAAPTSANPHRDHPQETPDDLQSWTRVFSAWKKPTEPRVWIRSQPIEPTGTPMPTQRASIKVPNGKGLCRVMATLQKPHAHHARTRWGYPLRLAGKEQLTTGGVDDTEPSSLSASVPYTDIAHGVGPQKMHPETQPLSSRAHSYSILALCFSTSVIFVDDYIVGMLARPQSRTDFYGENSGPDFFEAREMFEYQSNSRHPQDSVEMRWRQCGRRSVGEKKGARIVNALEPQFEPVSHNKL